MGDWSQVEYITSIKIRVDGDLKSSAIFGNKKNCVPITVSFKGMNRNGVCVNLRDVDVSRKVFLTNFDCSSQLYWNYLPVGSSGVFYSNEQKRFCNLPFTLHDSELTGSDVERRAHVTYYLYGNCYKDMKNTIGVMFKLHNGKTALINSTHKIDIKILKPITYTASSIAPLEWTVIEPKANRNIFTEHLVGFLKLKEEFQTGWAVCEFSNYSEKLGELLYISRAVRNGVTYHFYIAPLGPESVHVHNIEIGGLGSVPNQIEYNQEDQALCIYMLKVRGCSSVDRPTDHVLIKLFDSFGNSGQFKLNFRDPTSPSIVYDFKLYTAIRI